MESYSGKTISWELKDDVVELVLHRAPANEIGSETLEELERFVAELEGVVEGALGPTSGRPSAALLSASLGTGGTRWEPLAALVVHSMEKAGFSAGADLRELYHKAQGMGKAEATAGVRSFLERIHKVLNTIDAAPLVTIAAVHGVCFGGGLELALACDVIVADKMARFAFPELRLGLVPGFGGIPRLKRDVGNAVVRDLLLTGRSFNAQKANAVGLVSQVAAEGEALRVARATAAQVRKFDRGTTAAAKRFLKPVPHEELRREIELFCELFTRPAVMAGLKKFVENTEAMPYLP